MQIGVHEVVAQQHLQVGVQANVRQRHVVLVVRAVHVGGDQLALLKRLHLREWITGHYPVLCRTSSNTIVSLHEPYNCKG